MQKARYVVGIDLGTTHSVMAASPLQRRCIEVVPVPQLVAPGEVAARALLPSFLYLPADGELSPEQRVLPWGQSATIAGELARRLGAKAPSRVVASAKSWLCHGGINPRAPVLPWSAPLGEPHVSVLQAQHDYLEHLRQGWDFAHPNDPLAEQDVVIGVPASFDDGARALTLEAAAQAGLQTVRLLEEPQAAFYDFLGEQAANLAAALGDAKLVLVVDVGGGTTDLTLLSVKAPSEGSAFAPQLERIAIGGHLMLGGDNMDAALAHFALQKDGKGRRLDPSEWAALVMSAQRAKEQLLAADAPVQATVTLQERGSRMVGATRSIVIERDEVQRVLLDGFLPPSGPQEVAERSGRAGLTTLGLPYVTDPAIGRHICSFLRRHAQAASEAGAEVVDGLPRPDLLLLNGGVFSAPAIVERLSLVLAGMFGGRAVPLLPHTSLDTAVARGAVQYGLARRGHQRLIEANSARAYYIGVETGDGQRQALCVAPRGMRDGAAVSVPERIFKLLLNQPVAFPLYAYTGDRVDPAGAVLPVDPQLEALPPLQTVLRRPRDDSNMAAGSGSVPVSLSAQLSESGVLEIYLVTIALPPRRWRLEFALAKDTQPETPAPQQEPSVRAPELAGAKRLIRAGFSGDEQMARALRSQLESELGPRGSWSAPTCRQLFAALIQEEGQRKKSAQHEMAWLRLVGWCLRPGTGVAGDPARVQRVWQLHVGGLAFANKANWAEWWILWRRIALGLGQQEQHVLFEEVRPYLEPGQSLAGSRPGGQLEMLQMVAALERIPADDKKKVGEWFWLRAHKLGTFWPLGRLGARRSLTNRQEIDAVPRAVAEDWLARLLELDWRAADGAAFAAVLLAQPSGKQDSDVEGALRQQVLRRLQEIRAPSSWHEMLNNAQALASGAAGRLWGEALPSGLRFD